MFDLHCAIEAFASKLQILREEAEADSFSHFHHYLEFTVTMDVDFNETLDLEEEKQDLLEYLQNLAASISVRFPGLLSESFGFVHFLFKTDVKQRGSVALKLQNCKLTTREG